MTPESFDESFRQQVGRNAAPFDTEQAWAGIERKRRRKRRLLIWWWLSGSGMAVLLVVGLWWQGQKTEALAEVQAKETAPQISVKPLDPALKKSADTPISPLKAVSSKANGSEQQRIVARRASRQPVATHVRKPRAQAYVESGFGHQRSAEPATDMPGDREALPAAIIAQEDIENRGMALGDAESASAGVPVSNEEHPGRVEVEEMAAKNQEEVSASDEKPAIANASPAPASDPVRLPRRRKYTWECSVQGGYGFAGYRRSGSETDVLQRRNAEEKALDHLWGSVQGRVYLGRRFYVQTGLGLAQYTDRRTVQWTVDSTYVDDAYLLEEITRLDGSTGRVYGPAEVTRRDHYTDIRYNRYRSIQVPVMLGYTVSLPGSWRLDLSAGVIPAIHQRVSGYYTDATGNAAVPATAGYRAWGSVEGALQADLVMPLPWSGWYAGLGWNAQAHLNGMTVKSAGFDEMRRSSGLHVVIRRHMGRF
jgi:hypothetical protein